MAVQPVQSHGRFRNDDGNETTATWKAAEDANITLNKGADTTLRVRLQADAHISSPIADSVTLLFSKNGGAYAAVGAATNGCKLATSSNYTNHAATTAQLSVPNSDTFVAGTIQTNDAVSSSVSLNSGNYSEFEWCVKVVDADLAANDTLEFRAYLTTGPTAFLSYTVTPKITMAAAVTAGIQPGLTLMGCG